MNIAYAVAGLTLLGMVWFITQRAKSNRSAMLESNAPKVAGKMSLVVLLEILNNLTSPMRMPLRKWVSCWAKMTIQATKPESSIVNSTCVPALSRMR